MAEVINTTRVSVTRMLQQFEDENAAAAPAPNYFFTKPAANVVTTRSDSNLVPTFKDKIFSHLLGMRIE